MKILRFAVISFFMLFCLLTSTVSLGFEANGARARYLGEFCWQSEEGLILKLGVTNTGGGHYILNGRGWEPGGYVSAGHGNAEIVGSEVIMHFSASGFDDNKVWNWEGAAVLDGATLNGTWDGMETYCDKITGDCATIWSGEEKLTFISCP